MPPDDKAEDTQDILAAAKIGNLQAVKAFAERDGFEINKTFGVGFPRTASSFACEHGNHNVVEYLFQRGAEAKRENDEPTVVMTPILWAAEGGHVEVVHLLDKIVDSNCRSDDSGRTPLLVAAEKGHVKVVRMLIEHSDKNQNSTDSSGRTPLSIAAGHNHPSVVGCLLANADVVPDLCDNEGRTPLYFAAQAGHMSVGKLLASVAPATLNKTDYEGRTPLMAAAAEGRLEMVKWLLGQARVSPVSQDDNGWTALLHAIHWKSTRVVRLLMHHDNIAMHILTHQLRTVALTAIHSFPVQKLRWMAHITSQSRDYATTLLSAGYDINTRNEDGITPLQAAVRGLHYEVIVFLLGQNASMKGIMKHEWKDILRRESHFPEDAGLGILVRKSSVPEGLLSMSRDLADERDGDAGLMYAIHITFVCLLLKLESLVKDASLWDDFYKVLFDCTIVPLSSFELSTKSSAAGELRTFEHILADQRRVVVSMSFVLPHEEDSSQEKPYTRQKHNIRIAWSNPISATVPSLYLSTLPYGWTPDTEFELFEQFICKMEEAWAYTCRQAKSQLAEIVSNIVLCYMNST